jgi:hypothetical protein
LPLRADALFGVHAMREMADHLNRVTASQISRWRLSSLNSLLSLARFCVGATRKGDAWREAVPTRRLDVRLDFALLLLWHRLTLTSFSFWLFRLYLSLYFAREPQETIAVLKVNSVYS